jgi:hypothetical protein
MQTTKRYAYRSIEIVMESTENCLYKTITTAEDVEAITGNAQEVLFFGVP